MSLRAKWEFEYTAKTLAEAAAKQLEFRTSRVEYWTEKQNEVMVKIKASGLEIHEDITTYGTASNNLNLKYASSGMGGAQIVIDPTMQGDLTKCHLKIQQHTELARQYSAWKQVLDGNPEDRVKLDHDDWMFFFGK
jgi:hypothetical protein